jgi:hypothetical protein
MHMLEEKEKNNTRGYAEKVLTAVGSGGGGIKVPDLICR